MLTYEVENVHEALPVVLYDLSAGKNVVERDSRNGRVLVFKEPVTVLYAEPTQRVMFHPLRDANPFFHLFESLWMLGGRNDVAWVAHYVKRMKEYSDNGDTFHGAYGHRWINHFGFDQLTQIIRALQANKDDRRCVLQMWDARADLGKQGKDFPCNTQAMFAIDHEGRLNMTVINRSNDIIWGAFGANAVHFSVLQEYMAAAIGVPVGRYWQVSNNFHAYLSTYEPLKELAVAPLTFPYGVTTTWTPTKKVEVDVEPYPLVNTPIKDWQQDLHLFLEAGAVPGLNDPFFTRVVTPMYWAHAAFKRKEYTYALENIEQCQASDWRKACTEWLLRRKEKANG
jgi:thymidylate synthase